LDELTPEAGAIGAVNTIFLQGQRLVGDNTDAAGFLADLERVSGGIIDPETGEPRRALVLGAGGAARAVVYALARAGWQVVIAARRLEQAQAMAQSLNGIYRDNVRPVETLPLLPEALRRMPVPDLVVNATPLGMFPGVEATPWPEEVPFPQGTLVYDVVYNPAETRLVRQARRFGLPASTGLGMLVGQAALAFERWTGQSPPRQAMLAAVHLTQRDQ
jgi:shikimate dehydrogenase